MVRDSSSFFYTAFYLLFGVPILWFWIFPDQDFLWYFNAQGKARGFRHTKSMAYRDGFSTIVKNILDDQTQAAWRILC